MGTDMVFHSSAADVPLEILEEIFHYACVMSGPFCLSLSHTCTWARRLALPYLYSTIIITKLRTATLFREALWKLQITSQAPYFIPTGHLRSIWIQPKSNITLDIYRSCDRLRNLAVTQENLFWIIHASSSSSSKRVLSEEAINRKPDLNLLIFDAKTPTWCSTHLVPHPSPIFKKVAHLRIGRISGSYATYLSLGHFTGLTRIAIPYHNKQDHVLDDLLRLLDLPALLALVVVVVSDVVTELEGRKALRWVVDLRMTGDKRVWAFSSKLSNLRAEWEEEARGGEAIWDKAIRFTESLSLPKCNFKPRKRP